MSDMIASLKTVTALFGAGLAFATGNTSASTLIASNLEPLGPADYLVGQSNGAPLLAGSLGRLGAFPGMDDSQLVALLENDGPDALLAAFVPVGDGFVIGEGNDGGAGSFEISTEESLRASGAQAAAIGETPYLVLFNTPRAESASQLLLLAFASATFPEDPEVGFDGYLALHLRDASIVIGSDHATGFLAAELPVDSVDYSAWVVAAFGATAPPSDLLSSADPDGDGLDNLTEFGLGLDPTLGGESGQHPFVAIADDGSARLEFSLRVDALDLRVDVETSATLEEGWQLIDGDDLQYTGAEGSGANTERMSVPLPAAGGAALFARLRFSLPGE